MADQAINAISTKTAPETSDQLLLVGTGEPQLIDYDKLADAILNKITSKNYALDAGQMTLLAALNKLNSETIKTDNNFTGNVDNVRNSVVWCNTALNAPSNIGLLVSFSTFNIGQIFVDYTQFLIYIRWLNGNTNKWSEWSAI